MTDHTNGNWFRSCKFLIALEWNLFGFMAVFEKIKKNQGFEPVFVTFFEGLMGPGWFVCGGSSSPCGWEWGVCFGARAGFFMGLCGGCGRGWSVGWCRASSRWRSRSLLGPVLRGGFITDFLGSDACRGDIISNLFFRDKGYGSNRCGNGRVRKNFRNS